MTEAEQKLHELWAWCKDQPGYEPDRDRVKGLLGGIQAELVVRRRERVAENVTAETAKPIDWSHNGGPPWTFQTRPPGYAPPCGHRHGLYRCTDARCGYGLTPLTPAEWATVVELVRKVRT